MKRLRMCILLLVLGGLCLNSFTLLGAGHTRAKNSTRKPALRKPQAPAVTPGWWRRSVFYEVFVRSFQDSNGDGVGDLKGLIQRLDYLNDGNPATSNDLGVTALWLMPVFRSPSYHGYDTTDYYNINPAYGTNQDFKRLLREAHRRGIRIIIDYMINHTSSKHPWFQASKSKKSSYRNWYVWRRTNPGWTQPWGSGQVWHSIQHEFFYGIFWGGMPDLNFRHPPVREEMLKIAKHWIRMGVDGFRLDAARYLVANGAGPKQSDQPQTHAYWKAFRRTVKKMSPPTALIGEIWTQGSNIAPYCRGDEMDQSFHFSLASAMKSAAASMTAKPLWRVLSQKDIPMKCWATFLSNHDQERIMSQFHGNMRMMRIASAMLLTLPGTPYVYYGEEIGMTNGSKRHDEAKRTPMAWNASKHGGFTTGKPWYPLVSHKKNNIASQTGKADSLLSWYRRLIRLRHRYHALSLGSLVRVPLQGKGKEAVVAFVRHHPSQRILVIMNLEDQSKAAVQITLPFAAKRWKTLLRHGSGHVTHLNTTTQPTASPYTRSTPKHVVKLGPTSLWVVEL